MAASDIFVRLLKTQRFVTNR